MCPKCPLLKRLRALDWTNLHSNLQTFWGDLSMHQSAPTTVQSVGNLFTLCHQLAPNMRIMWVNSLIFISKCQKSTNLKTNYILDFITRNTVLKFKRRLGLLRLHGVLISRRNGTSVCSNISLQLPRIDTGYILVRDATSYSNLDQSQRVPPTLKGRGQEFPHTRCSDRFGWTANLDPPSLPSGARVPEGRKWKKVG